jgi:hypothetical protein
MRTVIIEIETAPIQIKDYFELPDTEQIRQLNPIDSRIIAIGARIEGKNHIIRDESEKKMLQDFWNLLEETDIIVGFNIRQFDIPFVTTRSFIKNVPITPFILKNIVDLRESISAFRFGPTRGSLKDYAEAVGILTSGMSGKDIPRLYAQKHFEMLEKYLNIDLEITEAVYKRAEQTNILKIKKW